MKLLNIERGTVSVAFEVWEMPTIVTLGRLAEAQAYDGDAPHDCTDALGMYASLFTAFCEAAEMAARLTVDSGSEPLTLEEHRAARLYYQGHAQQSNGAQLVEAAREAYPDIVAELDADKKSKGERGGAV